MGLEGPGRGVGRNMRTLSLLTLALLLGCAPMPTGRTAKPAPADSKAANSKTKGDRVKTVDELWTEAKALKDPKERIKIREQLIEMLEDPEARQVVNSELVQDYAEVGDVEKMEKAAA